MKKRNRENTWQKAKKRATVIGFFSGFIISVCLVITVFILIKDLKYSDIFLNDLTIFIFTTVTFAVPMFFIIFYKNIQNSIQKKLENRIYDSIEKKEKLIEKRKRNEHLEGTLSVSQDNSVRGELSNIDNKEGQLSKK